MVRYNAPEVVPLTITPRLIAVVKIVNRCSSIRYFLWFHLSGLLAPDYLNRKGDKSQ